MRRYRVQSHRHRHRVQVHVWVLAGRLVDMTVRRMIRRSRRVRLFHRRLALGHCQ